MGGPFLPRVDGHLEAGRVSSCEQGLEYNIFYSGKGKKLCIESHELILTFFLLSWAHMVYEGPRRKRSHADGSTVASPLLLECRNTVQFTFAHLIYAYGFMQCIV